MIKLRIIFLALGLLYFLTGCKHEPGEPILKPATGPTGDSNTNPIDSICFADSILPLLHSNCAKSGCHNDTTHASGIELSNYTTLNATVSGSLLLQAIQDNGPLGMPPAPNTKLTTNQIALIQRWVNEGMKNGVDCGDCPSDTINVSFAATIFPLIQTNCLGCHNSTTGTNLSSYNNIITQVTNGKLYCTINHQSGCLSMPLNAPKLCNGKIAQIENWINAGAPNN